MPPVSSNSSINQNGREKNGRKKNSLEKGKSRSLETGSSSVTSKDVAPCRLHRTSASVYRATLIMASISSLFPGLMTNAVKKVVESNTISSRYDGSCGGKNVAYTTVARMRQFPLILSYRFPLGDEGSSYGYILFDQQLPACLTDISFGASASPVVAGAASAVKTSFSLSKIHQYLLHKVASELARVWLKVWSRYFQNSEASAEWLGGIASSVDPFREDCLASRFYLEFSEPGSQQPPFQVPVSFFMPVNPLGNVLSGQWVNNRMSLPTSSALISRALLGIGVNITADLVSLSLPLARVGQLQVGDVIPIPKPEEAVLRIADIPLFDAMVAQYSGYLTLQINDLVYGGDSYDGYR
ncbi:FliM/FliN family flagellar motor switch protein [Endozoicomonas sp.]|uniref:FliM/FliN family flagellar motor switch protein n=1 Tax=Endozoicomonas sp. TaxID=1892382 RepID=UPI00383A88BF